MMGLRKRQAAVAKKRKRRWSVRPWLARRNAMGAEDPQQFRIFLRLSAYNLEEILRLVGPLISKKDITMREAISSNERLAVTRRFLASGKFAFFFLI